MIALFKSWPRLLLVSLALLLMFASGGGYAQNAGGRMGIAVPDSRDPPPDEDPPYNSAAFAGQSVPATMVTGTAYSVSVSMFNNGTKTWSPGASYALGSQNPHDNTTWGGGRAGLAGSVGPGQTAAFNFQITAPGTPGTYNFQWMMVQDGVEWFGPFTPNVAVTVNAPAPVNGAQVLAVSAPSPMTHGQSYTVSVTMQNTGNTTWPAGGAYKLGSKNPIDNWTWGTARTALASSVAPGQQTTFTFAVAPPEAGSYNMQWGMVQEGVEWFGATSSTAVTVIAPAQPTISVTRTPNPMLAGQPFTLTWSSANATSLTRSCSSTGTGYTVNDAPATSGSGSATASSAWVNYPSTCTWTATGAGGSATYTETMTTNAPGDVVTYIHTDGLGSPVARSDANGAEISRTRYEPYGATAAGATPTIGFTGHVNDADTGLVYMQQRYYDPVAGRFLSIDPVTTDANTGGSFNRYSYAENNPYKYVDPDGRNPALVLARVGMTSYRVANSLGAARFGVWISTVIWNAVHSDLGSDKPSVLTPSEENHILNSDDEGGGHRPGLGRPGKSEFPPGWTDGKIVGEVSDVLNDPNSTTKPGRDGATVIEGTRDCVVIRCVVGPNGQVLTAYPVKGPGVVQNPKKPPEKPPEEPKVEPKN